MTQGRTQLVQISARPTEATIRVDGNAVTQPAPVTLPLKRKNSHTLLVESPGYEPESVVLQSKASKSLWRNAFLIHPFGWVIGTIVDLSTGAGYELHPARIDVELTPTAGKLASPLQSRASQ